MDTFKDGVVQAPLVQQTVEKPKPSELVTEETEVAKELAMRPYRQYFNATPDMDGDIDFVVGYLKEPSDTPSDVLKKLTRLQLRLGGSYGPSLRAFVQHIRMVMAVKEAMEGAKAWPN